MEKELKNRLQRISESGLIKEHSDIAEEFKKSYNEILRLSAVSGLIGTTLLYKKRVLKRIDRILERLDRRAKIWIEREIPKAYKNGLRASEEQLTILGFELKKRGLIHNKAINLFSRRTYVLFGEALKTARKDAKGIIDLAIENEITNNLAKGVDLGKPVKEIAKDLKKVFERRGISSFIDKSGRRWQLDTYTEMLARTRIAETYRSGQWNRQIENGFDLAQITAHGAPDDCINVEGKVFSLTGNTPGYPTEDDIMGMSDHIFRPNCAHRTTTYVPEFEEDPDGVQELSNKSKPISTNELKDQGFRMDTKTRNQTMKDLAKK